MPEVTEGHIAALLPEFITFPAHIRRQCATDAIYTPYLERQNAEVAALRRDEAVEIPADLNYSDLRGMSTELKCKLQRKRPCNLAEAARIEGVTPAALTLILAYVRSAARNNVAI